ncbi:SAM-dependent methyltransferase [Aureimonas sp. SA4125]|uniref:DUF938 domain-containing protein n=1 Tax=Aureimonas sp. SA4125 TaxID=2826993 RepID=UPI001CC7C210|nr:DUF938 domain-containing protein [Aureimonas sp. SA4125]BDA85672.1 SAM-dependent methyltransferase [Aureimonas sp. SA4125]
MLSPDDRRSSPAALRNRDPILGALRNVLPAKGTVLEIASGTGEHILHFAGQLPELTWQPSDASPEARASIAAWMTCENRANLLPPLDIDAAGPEWPIRHADAILAINLIHISPWAATLGLMRHAGEILPRGAPLLLYGPFRRGGAALEPSNAAFDEDLRLRDPAWGIRDLDAVAAVAEAQGLILGPVRAMPANNLTVIFTRA